MGIPTNQTKGQGCSPVSSNCVVWQGPDIPCIDLCHGDSVTDVVFKLATELCDILDTLDIKTYDIECFKPICPDPQNFHDLIQFLITKICELQCCCDGTKPSESACPDACIVTVASCFQYTNQLGDLVTTMPLKDYVIAIGNKICENAGQIAQNGQRSDATEETVTEQGEEITALTVRVDALTVTIPSSTRLGPAPPGGWPVVTVVQAIDTDLANLESATGTPIELLQAIQQQCVNMDGLKTLANRQMTYSGINGWITQAGYNTVADSLNNMWLTICDMRAAVENILLTCCCTDCDDVNIVFSATLTGEPATTLNLFFTGSIPTGLTDCFPTGNMITITDSNGGTYTTFVEVVDNLNDFTSINLVGTPVNPALDLTIIIQGCWKRPAPGSDCGGLECSRTLTFVIINTAPCPVLTLTPGNTSIYWEFTNMVPNNVSYSVNLFLGGIPVASMGAANPGVPVLVSGTFNGLTSATEYYIEIVVTINGGTAKTCPQKFVTTLCSAPIVNSVTPNAVP